MKDRTWRARLPLFLAFLGGVAFLLHLALRMPWVGIVVASILGLFSAWLGPRVGPVVRPDIYNADGTKRAKAG